MRAEEAHLLVQAMERRLVAARRLVRGPVDGAVAHEYIAAMQAEHEAREAMLGTSWNGLTLRTSSPSQRA